MALLLRAIHSSTCLLSAVSFVESALVGAQLSVAVFINPEQIARRSVQDHGDRHFWRDFRDQCDSFLTTVFSQKWTSEN